MVGNELEVRNNIHSYHIGYLPSILFVARETVRMPRNQSSAFAFFYPLKHIGKCGAIERLKRARLILYELNIQTPEGLRQLAFLRRNASTCRSSPSEDFLT